MRATDGYVAGFARVDAAITFNADQRRLVKQLARRRMFLFFFGLIGLSAVVPPYPGSARTLAALLIVLAASVAAIVVIAVGWRRQSPGSLRIQHNILFALSIVLVALLPLNPDWGRVLFTAMLVINRLF